MMALAIDAANDACGEWLDFDCESLDDLDDFGASLFGWLLSLLVFTQLPFGSLLSIVKFIRGSGLSPVNTVEVKERIRNISSF